MDQEEISMDPVADGHLEGTIGVLGGDVQQLRPEHGIPGHQSRKREKDDAITRSETRKELVPGVMCRLLGPFVPCPCLYRPCQASGCPTLHRGESW